MLSTHTMINRIRSKGIIGDMVVSTVMDFVRPILMMMQMMKEKKKIGEFHMVLP